MLDKVLNITSDDLLLWTIAFVFIAAVTASIQYFSRNVKDTSKYRKALHFIAISTCAYVIGSSENSFALGGLMLVLGILLWVITHKNLLNISTGKSLGVALFPLAFSILLLFDLADLNFIATAAYILATADALAGLIGSTYGKKKLQLLAEEKSVIGSLVFLATTLIIISWIHPFLALNSFFAIIIISLMITSAEAFSWKGSDNFTIPISAAILFHLLNQGNLSSSSVGLSVLGIGLVFIPVSIRLKWLSLGGAIAAVTMALFIAMTMGYSYLLFPLLFLFLGSIFSKLNPKEQREKKGRVASQVFANGGVAIGLGLIYYCNPTLVSTLFILSFSVALSDTASSEIGKFFKGKVWDIIRFKSLKKGLSGGISFQGTLAGLVFAFILPAIAYVFAFISAQECLSLSIAAFLGMLIDSVIGSLFKGKFLVNGELIETYSSHAELQSGYSWMTNDLVNFLSILLSVFTYYILTV